MTGNSASLNREILRLSVPSILANITVPLVGMVDIAIAGHLSSAFGSAALIGGISVGTMLFDLVYWCFGFLRTGTGGLTAQAFGAGSSRTGQILLRALRIAILSGLALLLVQWLVIQGAFLVVKCSPEVRQLATQYFYIRIWAAPATLSLFALKGWFIGMQDSVRPMTADLIVNGVNILASLVLSLGIPGLFGGLGFRGIALGTVVAQWSGFAYCLLALRRRYRGQFTGGGGQVSGGGTFLKLNLDLFLRSVGMIAVYIGFTIISARFGDIMLAVSTILMKFLMIFSYFTDGFAYAGEALTGRFIGARDAYGLRAAVRGVFVWSFGVAAVFILAYGLGGVPLLKLMTSDSSVVEAGRQFIPWLLLMPLIGCAAFVWDGVYIGATASRDLRNATLLCAVGFFAVWFAGSALGGATVGAAGALTPVTAIHILMGAYFMHLAIRTLYLTARYPKAITI